jgi:hypothetical protein
MGEPPEPPHRVVGVEAGRIQAGRDIILNPSPGGPAAAAGRARSNIPTRGRAPHVGRDGVIEEIRKTFADPTVGNVVILRGKPGVGKSATAREFGRRYLDNYPGGAFVVGGAAIDIDFAQLGRVSLCHDYGHLNGVQDQGLRTFVSLSQARTLLIFDGVESGEQIKSWLPPAGSPTHMLITSQYDVWGDAWSSILVPPLDQTDAYALVEAICGAELAARYGDRLVAAAGGLPVELRPAARNLRNAARRGGQVSIPTGMSSATVGCFDGPYYSLPEGARLVLKAAVRLNIQRIDLDELRIHMIEGAGWSDDEFNAHLDACIDLHLLDMTPEPSMHQVIAAFVMQAPIQRAVL